MQFNIPVLLTIFRFIIIPLFMVTFYLPFILAQFVNVMIFLIAAATDWFDGYLARLWNQKTNFGAFLDPVADKVISAIAMILLTEYYHTWWVTLPISIMIAREIIISSLREWMAELGKRNSITVSKIARLKTTTQMIALIWMLYHPNQNTAWIGVILLWIAMILTLWSMLKYLNVLRKIY